MNDKIKIDIIDKAWNIIKEDIKIKKFYFIPGIISIIFLTIILVYQVIYTYVVLFDQNDKALKIILDVFHSKYFFEFIIVGLIFLLIYIILVPIFEGSLIWYLAKKEENKDFSLGDSMGNGIYRFLPLFEYSNIISQFKFISIVNIYLFCLRFIGTDYILFTSYVFLFILFISVIINVLFAYCKYEIVLNNKKALDSISSSIKIAILNLPTTIRIYFFMFLVNIRIIINFLVFLFFPIIIATAITYITTKIFLLITVIILSIIFLIFIVILGYLGGVLEIFKTAIRYYAYVEGKKKLDELGEKE